MIVNPDQVVKPANNHTNSKSTILVVDDSRVVRVSLKNILQQSYNLVEAENGEIAWRILKENPSIRLVFSDLAMPKLDGRQLLHKLRQSDAENFRNMPFIVITGREDDQEIRAQLIQEGANALVTKPFDYNDITDYAKRHVGSRSGMGQQDSRYSEEFYSGITNKEDFSQTARKQLSFAIRNKNELALLLLKFDQFEKIQKHYSDPAIEHILITAAEIIRSYARIEDAIAYFGEGTFAILLPATNSVVTKHLGRKILSDLHAKKFFLGESDTTVTASIGVSAPDIKPGTTFSDLLGLAEQRLQAAVNAGGNRVVDKGNAMITPVSTLLNETGKLQAENQEILRQTEISMRKLAELESQQKKAKEGPLESKPSEHFDVNIVNDALASSEQENRRLNEEILRLREQLADTHQLKKQLHEIDALYQQTMLKYQQSVSKLEQMRIRAESAESMQNRLLETDNDRSIIEQHLLQESERIQKQLTEANEQIIESARAHKVAEYELQTLKERFRQQKEEFEIELADEKTVRSIAENKLAELEKQLLEAKKEVNPFALTATPTLPKIEETPELVTQPTVKPPPISEPPINATTPSPVQPKKKESQPKMSGRHKRSWSFRLLVTTICVLFAVACYRVWIGYSSQQSGTKENAIQLNIPTEPLIEDVFKKPTSGKETADNQMKNKTRMPSVAKQAIGSQKLEEAKLEAEMTLRQIAEEEFLMLSSER